MSDIAVRLEDLSKQYYIGHKQDRYKTLRDTLTEALTSPFRRAGNLLRGQAYGAAELAESIWALKDVSFEVKHGEVVGIIGRNGAGKSTLLKVLSRITEPTTGYADVYGRVGALLEVGTGFHLELTGRENIYLNGAILGMGRKEIDRKFDEIIDFAGVEKFIDTPVKHYSSGMSLRLGFAVAAHLEPEILVVDEVLAVGDAEFQKKCLGKMSDVASGGRTVLFVSHNMAAVRSLCSKAFLLENGQLVYAGEVGAALQHYQAQITRSEASPVLETSRGVSFTHVEANDSTERLIDSTQPFTVSFDLRIQEQLTGYALYCIIMDADNQIVIHSGIESSYSRLSVDPGLYKIRLDYPPLWLRPGLYTLHLKLIADKTGKGRYLSDIMALDVIGNTDPKALIGYLAPDPLWSVNPAPDDAEKG